MVEPVEIKKLVHVNVPQETLSAIAPGAKFLFGHDAVTGEVRIYYDENVVALREATDDYCKQGGRIRDAEQLTLLQMEPPVGVSDAPCCYYVICCGRIICIPC